MPLSGLPIVDKSARRLGTQRGFSLLEIMAALAIGVLMMTSLTSMVDATLQDTKGQQTAQYQAQFASAAMRYLNDNATLLLNSVASSPSGTYAVNLATLQPAYLPNAFASKNAYAQAPCMLLRKNAATPTQLDALVVTEGANAIPPKDIGYIAANAGTGGGSIQMQQINVATSPTIAIGAYDAWQLDQTNLSLFTNANCSGVSATVGNMATLLAYGGPNAINRNVLFRNQTADPSLNQMNIPLGFTAGATGAMKIVGDTCASAGITLDSTNGNILKCNTTTGLWENSTSKYWKDPVATFASLPTPAVDGEVRMTLDTGRAFMFKTGQLPYQWMPLAADQFGDLAVSRNLAVGNNITATQTVKGNLLYADSAVVAQSLSATLKRFVAGDGCNYPGYDATGALVTYLAIGTVVSDLNGLIMECRLGTATTPAPGTPTGSQGIFLYVDGTSTTPP